jgi:hypothetical protein
MEVSMMTGKQPEPVTRETWKPGLPPPIEGLREKFRPQDGWTIDYGEWIEIGDDGEVSKTSIATVRRQVAGGYEEATFFPKLPREAPAMRSER